MGREVSQQTDLLGHYAGGDNKDAAVRVLFDLIVRHAKEMDFAGAKALREKLVQLDPLAVTEIVRSGEIIEQEQKKVTGQDKMKSFAQLNAALSPEEKSALCHLLNECTYEPDTFVFRQGELNFNLYLIETGQLKMTYDQEGREILLKTLAAGNVAGDDTFLRISVCTTSLITLCRSKLYTLDRKELTRLRDNLPTLESKVIRYCQGLETVYQVMAKKRLERRAYKRIKISGRATIQIQRPPDSPPGQPFAGELSDLSVGGLAVSCKIGENLNPRTLLGRKLNIKFDLPRGAFQQRVDKEGTIVAISSPSESHCLHVKFDELLSESTISGIGVAGDD